jgi:hypothetical protein
MDNSKNLIIRNNELYSFLYKEIDWIYICKEFINPKIDIIESGIVIQLKSLISNNENNNENKEKLLKIQYFLWSINSRYKWNFIYTIDKITIYFDVDEWIILSYENINVDTWQILNFNYLKWEDIVCEHFYDDNNKFLPEQPPLFWLTNKENKNVMIQSNWKRLLNYFII